MNIEKLAYLRTATKVRPSHDIVFTQNGVPTGKVIDAGRESSSHDIYPEGFIEGYVVAYFDLPVDKQWVSWAGTLIRHDSTTSKADEFDYFIDGQWLTYEQVMA